MKRFQQRKNKGFLKRFTVFLNKMGFYFWTWGPLTRCSST